MEWITYYFSKNRNYDFEWLDDKGWCLLWVGSYKNAPPTWNPVSVIAKMVSVPPSEWVAPPRPGETLDGREMVVMTIQF